MLDIKRGKSSARRRESGRGGEWIGLVVSGDRVRWMDGRTDALGSRHKYMYVKAKRGETMRKLSTRTLLYVSDQTGSRVLRGFQVGSGSSGADLRSAWPGQPHKAQTSFPARPRACLHACMID